MYYITNIVNYINNLEPVFKGFTAVVMVLFGWLFAAIIKRIVIAFLHKIKFNQVIKRLGWQDILERAKFHIDGEKFFGKIVEWIIFIIFLMIAFNVAEIDYIANLLTKVVSYLPNIFISSLIFIAAIFLSDFSYRIVIASTSGKSSCSKIIGTILRGFIWTFAVLAILLQLGIASEIIKIIIYGIIFMIALAGGLAFGLGGKDIVAELLKELKEKIS